ncbi:XTP/dITP diphosphatase [Paraglaciecola psychrophila]|uniref:dITP/XTP pyrophosphatase n=1 Tax=Paraglaciecola psychrophila 170 TaxID=1129794 RepID=K6Z3X2_9ALTE|nr:XTP/dITP diphosphatase [Paraglaciecola psychrophila]AGH43658.1 putative deoxyribonucleotide triphosphate pyrophosphatase [Paraglaciecola psychrophila 170]GAC39759.1 nucleoside-triphosphate pyrophosphatase [Paraglaciecola psychrophila 170]
MSKKIVLATGNKGKVKELAAMLSGLSIEVLPQSDFSVTEVAETGSTFIENAIIKARHASEHTGLPAIADDSGLAVDALGGAPGVYSARYSGDNATDQSNITKLLGLMADVPNDKRQAKFLCVLVYMRHADDPSPIICQGEWCGEIMTEPQGDNGFGYDPIFWVNQQNSSSAQLSSQQKNALSHRGKALKLLLAQLQNQIG